MKTTHMTHRHPHSHRRGLVLFLLLAAFVAAGSTETASPSMTSVLSASECLTVRIADAISGSSAQPCLSMLLRQLARDSVQLRVRAWQLESQVLSRKYEARFRGRKLTSRATNAVWSTSSDASNRQDRLGTV